MTVATAQSRIPHIKRLAAARACGDRIKYLGGCRCVPCRAANSRYETERAAARRRGEWNGLIDAAEVRRHLLRLSRRGIGRHTVADITGLSRSSIDQYRSGQRRNIRAMNAKKILAIAPEDRVNDAQLISARRTREQIQWMLNEGFTKAEIARRLGYTTPALQIARGGLITTRNAQKVEQLYNRLRLGE